MTVGATSAAPMITASRPAGSTHANSRRAEVRPRWPYLLVLADPADIYARRRTVTAVAAMAIMPIRTRKSPRTRSGLFDPVAARASPRTAPLGVGEASVEGPEPPV